MSEHNEHLLRVTSRAFCCGVTVRDGKVFRDGTAPYLRRLSGMSEETFMQYARDRGWKVEQKKVGG